MPKSHTIRVRENRWSEIEAKAWKLSQKVGKLVKPTDIADAALKKGLKELSIEDIEAAKKDRIVSS